MRQSTARNNSTFFLKALFESSGEIEKVLFMGDQSHCYNSTNDSSILAVSIHLGDVETFEVLDELASHPVSLVFGNCDYVNRLSDYVNSIGLDVQHPVGTLQIGDTGIGYLHGDNLGHYQNLLHDSSIQVVFYGHLHNMKVLLINIKQC